jgi:hypothetical protein
VRLVTVMDSYLPTSGKNRPEPFDAHLAGLSACSGQVMGHPASSRPARAGPEGPFFCRRGSAG